MNDEYFYADVNLPFHVWVREPQGAHGFRWVLREAPQLQQATQQATQGNSKATTRDGSARGADFA